MVAAADVVVIGGGVMGASILYSLADRGVDNSVLLERDTLGSGSTGRSSGAIRMHYSTEVNARLAWESLRVFQNWSEIIGGDGDPGFVRTGYMVIAPDHESEGFRHNIAMQQQVGIDTRIVSWQDAEGACARLSSRRRRALRLGGPVWARRTHPGQRWHSLPELESLEPRLSWSRQLRV